MAQTPQPVELGRSLALEDGDFQIDAHDRGRDLRQVRGSDNFAQVLQVIIGTPFGSDPVNVNYGLDVLSIYTTPITVRGAKDVIRLNIVKSLAGDERIQQIDDVVFDDDPEFENFGPEFGRSQLGATARKSRIWHAVASLTLATGPLQVTISGVAP